MAARRLSERAAGAAGKGRVVRAHAGRWLSKLSMITERPGHGLPPRLREPVVVNTAGPRVRRDRVAVLRAYVALTKPRIVELLLVTTVPAMVVAAGGWPDLGLVLVVLVGGSLAAGAA